MTNLIHIRVGKELKKQMEMLINIGLFSNQAEIAREGIRDILLKYGSSIESGGLLKKTEIAKNEKRIK